jgi:hypothetical protein
MYEIVLSFHSVIAWLVLLFILFGMTKSMMGIIRSHAVLTADLKIARLATLFIHLQFILGLILLVVSPLTQAAYSDMGSTMKDSLLRQMAVEHPITNLIAVVLVTIAGVKIKKENARYKPFFYAYMIAFFLLLSRIPYENWLS